MNSLVKEEKVHNPGRRYEYALKRLFKSSFVEENKEHIEGQLPGVPKIS